MENEKKCMCKKKSLSECIMIKKRNASGNPRKVIICRKKYKGRKHKKEVIYAFNTSGRIKGYISIQQLVKYIRRKYDSVSVEDVRCIRENHSNYISGHITFYSHGKECIIYYYYRPDRRERDNYTYRIKHKEMADTVTTNLDMVCYHKHQPFIMWDLVRYFGGGWIDIFYCDEFLPVPAHRKRKN